MSVVFTIQYFATFHFDEQSYYDFIYSHRVFEFMHTTINSICHCNEGAPPPTFPSTDSRNKQTTLSYLYIILPEQHCPMLLLTSSKSCKLVLLLPFLVRAFMNDFLSIHSETGFLSRPLFPQLLKIWFYSIWSWTCIIRPDALLMSSLQEML